MFGYDYDDIGSRQQRWEAQLKWPFLTEADMLSIHTKHDLTRLVQARRSMAGENAQDEVDAWMVGYWFRLMHPQPANDRHPAN